MAIGLPSLHDRVGRLQTSLQAKAKAEPAYRFYTLWDKVCRVDVLAEAYRRCRANRGAPGVDGETFEAIEDHGVEAWLERLRQELCSRAYRPRPLLRVWIPKSNGGQRPLGIPPIRDRVAQAAMVIVLEPIFEVDLLPNQYGFRPKLDAKMAVRRAYWHITDSGRTEVVDADLRDYFGSDPARSADALCGATGRGRHGAVRDQELAGGTGGRAHPARRPAYHRGAGTDTEGRRRARFARPCSATSTSVGSSSLGSGTATARGSMLTSSTTQTTS